MVETVSTNAGFCSWTTTSTWGLTSEVEVVVVVETVSTTAGFCSEVDKDSEVVVVETVSTTAGFCSWTTTSTWGLTFEVDEYSLVLPIVTPSVPFIILYSFPYSRLFHISFFFSFIYHSLFFLFT